MNGNPWGTLVGTWESYSPATWETIGNTPIQDSWQTSWNDLVTLTDTWQTRWNDLASIEDSWGTSWNLQGIITITDSWNSQWNVFEDVYGSWATSWHLDSFRGIWDPVPDKDSIWTADINISDGIWNPDEPEVFGWGTSGYGDNYGDPYFPGYTDEWDESPDVDSIWTAIPDTASNWTN